MRRVGNLRFVAPILAAALLVGGISVAVMTPLGAQARAGAVTPVAAVSGSVHGTASAHQGSVSATLVASVSGYPGPIVRPDIPLGPPIGSLCQGGTSPTSYVCGFMPGSQVTFELDGVAIGTARADSNGCVAFAASVSNDLKLTIETFGGSSPKGLGPVPIGFGIHHIIVKGIGGPGPYSGQAVGMSKELTVDQCGPPITKPDNGGLAYTGAQITLLELIAAGLLVAGGFIVVAIRRRRHGQPAQDSLPPRP